MNSKCCLLSKHGKSKYLHFLANWTLGSGQAGAEQQTRANIKHSKRGDLRMAKQKCEFNYLISQPRQT